MKNILFLKTNKHRVLKPTYSTRSSQKGYTLVELMVVVAIIGILAAVSTPGFLNWLPNHRLNNAAMDIYSTLQKARLYSVKSSTAVRVAFFAPVAGVPGSYIMDIDEIPPYGAGAPSLSAPDEIQVSMGKYGSGVDFGFRAGVADWTGAAIATPIGFTTPIGFLPPGVVTYCTFSPQGTSTAGTVYILNGQQHLVYAISTFVSGAIKIRQYNGIMPFNQNNWN